MKRVGQELGVRYVLEGSVQRSRNRMRVNVQLIDSETGNHLWAERFDKPDEIVGRLANQLATELVTAEARRAERAPHPNSMDLSRLAHAFDVFGHWSRRPRGILLNPGNRNLSAVVP